MAKQIVTDRVLAKAQTLLDSSLLSEEARSLAKKIANSPLLSKETASEIGKIYSRLTTENATETLEKIKDFIEPNIKILFFPSYPVLEMSMMCIVVGGAMVLISLIISKCVPGKSEKLLCAATAAGVALMVTGFIGAASVVRS